MSVRVCVRVCVCAELHMCAACCAYCYVSSQPPLASGRMMETVCHPPTSPSSRACFFAHSSRMCFIGTTETFPGCADMHRQLINHEFQTRIGNGARCIGLPLKRCQPPCQMRSSADASAGLRSGDERAALQKRVYYSISNRNDNI